MTDKLKIVFPEYPEFARFESRLRHGSLTSARIFRSWGILVDNMTDEEAGKVWKQVFKFMKYDDIETADIEPLSDLAKAVLIMAVSSIEDAIERDIGKALVSNGVKVRKDTKDNGEKDGQ